AGEDQPSAGNFIRTDSEGFSLRRADWTDTVRKIAAQAAVCVYGRRTGRVGARSDRRSGCTAPRSRRPRERRTGGGTRGCGELDVFPGPLSSVCVAPSPGRSAAHHRAVAAVRGWL